MGAIGTYRPVGMSDAEFFGKEYPDIEILDTARVAGVAYVKMRDKTGTVFMFVSRCGYRGSTSDDFGREFVYRMDDESVGPVDAKCPLRMLEGLSPPCNEYAAEWRQRVRDYHASKKSRPKPGQRIKLAEPLKFTNGKTLDTFDVVRVGKAGIAFADANDPWQKYRISKIQERQFEVIAADKVGAT